MIVETMKNETWNDEEIVAVEQREIDNFYEQLPGWNMSDFERLRG